MSSRKGYIWVIIGATTGLAYFFYDDGSRSSRVILDALKAKLQDIKIEINCRIFQRTGLLVHSGSELSAPYHVIS